MRPACDHPAARASCAAPLNRSPPHVGKLLQVHSLPGRLHTALSSLAWALPSSQISLHPKVSDPRSLTCFFSTSQMILLTPASSKICTQLLPKEQNQTSSPRQFLTEIPQLHAERNLCQNSLSICLIKVSVTSSINPQGPICK